MALQEIYNSIRGALNSIPPVVWSGVIGAIIALFGTWLQNRAHLKRQKEQLSHDAEQRRVDREMDMRREVYLKATEAVARLQEYLAYFLRSDITFEQNQDAIKGVWAEIGKVYLIGSMETLEATTNLYKIYCTSVLRITEKRVAVNQIASEISEHQLTLQEIIKWREQIIIAIQAAAESKDGDLVHKLISKFEATEAEVKSLHAQIELLSQSIIPAQIELTVEVSKSTQEFEQITADTLVAVRREINFGIDETKYKALVAGAGDAVRNQLEQWIKNLLG